MPFFVRITPTSPRERLSGALYAFDLTEGELLDRVVDPYRRGDAITLGGRTLAATDITQIDIREAVDAVGSHPLAELRPEWTSGNRRRIGDRIARYGEDVTDRYITGPTGEAVQGPSDGEDAREPDERTGRATDGAQPPGPIRAGVGVLAVIGVVLTIISSRAWVAGGAIGCVLAVAGLHRHVWRWPPALWAVVVVAVITVAGGLAGWGIGQAVTSASKQSSSTNASPGGVPSGPGRPETAGGAARTWSNYRDAGGTSGPPVQPAHTIKVACRAIGYRVPDGNTWWYRIASAPWNGRYYVTADAFYNNGHRSGRLQGTLLVDRAVRLC